MKILVALANITF